MALQPPSDGFFTQLVKAVSEGDRPIRNIVVLTGAGISVESGVRPFNGPGGWWEEHNIKDVAHKDSDPQRVREFYEDMHRQAENATPNAAHRALAELAEKFKGKLTIITQ